MPDFNRVILLGRLTRDPELRVTGTGTPVCTLSLAVNRRTKKDDRWEEVVSFFDVVTFGKLAENCAAYLAKGRPILVEGELQQRRWEKEGQKRSKVEVVAGNVQFLGSKGDNEPKQQNEQGPAPDPEPPLGDDEIPF